MRPADLFFWTHVLGFLTGIILYAMLALMAWQGRTSIRWPGQTLPSPPPTQAPLLLIIAALGLILSISTNILHLNTFLHPGTTTPRSATWLIVTGYTILMTLIAIHMWHLTTIQRALALTAIGVFAVSAAHMLLFWGEVESLPVELIVHYAPLPLVAALLYQEYRFALADVFFKRALTLIILVIMASVAYLFAQSFRSGIATVLLWIATALAYPVVRDGIYNIVDRLVLRRATAKEVRARLAAAIGTADTVESVLDRASHILRDALTARWVTWSEDTTADHLNLTPSARITVPAADTPRYVITIGTLAGGRRLLSGDMNLAEIVALDVARRIDTIRIAEERFERTTRETEIVRLATEAELQTLQAQLNPHFLFNALTTIGYLIQVAPDRALSTLLRLTELLRAVLRRTSGSLVTVRDELALVESYLAIERERFEERLRTQIELPEHLQQWKIPPLLIQPLVENAIKHGIAPVAAGGTIRVVIASTTGIDGQQTLQVRVEDTGAGATKQTLIRGQHQGVGLSNIERRIQRYYGPGATLTVESVLGQGTTVQLILPQSNG